MWRLPLIGFLACGLAGCGEHAAEPERADAHVTILPAGEGAPTRYRLGDRETADVEELGRWLRELRQIFNQGDIAPHGKVYANHLTPDDRIAAVLDEFAAAGFEKVDFYGGNPEITRDLPFPESDAR